MLQISSIILHNNLTNNKSAQSNLGSGPRRSAKSPRGGFITTAANFFGPRRISYSNVVVAESRRVYYAAAAADRDIPGSGIKITPFRRPILIYLPHSWTHPTYHPKRRPYPFSHFSTMHWTDRQTDRQTNRWFARRVCDYRPLSLCGERRGLIMSGRISRV